MKEERSKRRNDGGSASERKDYTEDEIGRTEEEWPQGDGERREVTQLRGSNDGGCMSSKDAGKKAEGCKSD